jgi:hypothetical protein
MWDVQARRRSGLPAVTLKAVAMLSKAFAGDLAGMAGHWDFPLESYSVLPDTELAGSSRRKL